MFHGGQVCAGHSTPASGTSSSFRWSSYSEASPALFFSQILALPNSQGHTNSKTGQERSPADWTDPASSVLLDGGEKVGF